MSDILVLGGTGKTGRRVAAALRTGGHAVRTAARSGADVGFDWDVAESRQAALRGVDRVYLMLAPGATDPSPIHAFLEQARDAGVRHVTALSARGVEAAPEDVPLRAMELALAAGTHLTWTVLRPSWFMQNYTEGNFAAYVEAGVLSLPLGDGAEAFIDAEDIAAVAAATLIDPDAHAGKAYDLTGPEALTQTEVAQRLTDALGRKVTYEDAEPAAWEAGLRSAGVPDGQVERLVMLTETIRSGNGAPANGTVRAATGREPRSFTTFLA